MKKLLFILLISIPFIGFGQSEEKNEYWDNGQVLSQIHYLDGKRDGSCRHWYKNGQLMNEGFYKNGKMTGYWMSYYENGQIQSESIIKDGVEELKFYDKEGNLLPEGEGC